MSAEAEDLVERLRAAGCVFAEEEAALLLEAAGSAAELDRLVAERVAGRPLEQILGWVEFAGLRIVVEPGVFVPRRRTGFLVEQAVGLAGRAPLVVDLCCGSGAIGAALTARLPDLDLYAADLDPVCARCARRNLPGARVFQGDLFAALPVQLRGRVDLLVVNAPYVPTDAIAYMPPEARDHEPRLALDGGADGLDVHRRIAAGAPDWLAPGGHLLIETSELQAPGARSMLAAVGLGASVVHSEDVDSTVVIGTWSPPARQRRDKRRD